MSNLGYRFESFIEDWLLSFTGQTKKDPLLISDKGGVIRINRSFRVPGSGAMDSLCGDCISYLPWLKQQLKIEAKDRFLETKKEGQIFVLEKEWLMKNNREALIDNQIPLLLFAFKRTQKNRIWCTILHQELVKLYKVTETLINIKVKNEKRIKLLKTYLDENYRENIMFSFKIESESYLLFPLQKLAEIILGVKNDI